MSQLSALWAEAQLPRLLGSLYGFIVPFVGVLRLRGPPIGVYTGALMFGKLPSRDCAVEAVLYPQSLEKKEDQQKSSYIRAPTFGACCTVVRLWVCSSWVGYGFLAMDLSILPKKEAYSSLQVGFWGLVSHQITERGTPPPPGLIEGLQSLV